MPVELKFDVSKEFASARNSMQTKMSASNLRFAMAKSLTQLAQESQKAVKSEMPRKFMIRRDWVKNGIRIKTATKSGLWSAVYSLDSGGRRPFMTRQEFGGIKTAESRTHVAVPWRKTTNGESALPSKEKLIPDILKPKSLLGTVVQVNNARAGVQSHRQSGIRRQNKKGRVWVSTSSQFKTLKVEGKRKGIQWILIKKNGKYIPAWMLIDHTKIKKTQFLFAPTARIINQQTTATIIRNMYEAIKPRGTK